MTDTKEIAALDLKLVTAPQDLIAVGIDFTPQSKIASERATALAKATDSGLLDVHVVPGSAVVSVAPTGSPDVAVMPAPTAEGKAALKAASGLVKEMTAADAVGVAAESVVRVGRPYEELAHVAELRGAWLLVVGVAPRISPTETILLGTTAELALRHGPTPVLLARENAARNYGRVLLPLDAGDLSFRVAKLVARIAPDGEYDVVHFLPPGGAAETKTRAHRDSTSASLAGLCLEAGLDVKRTHVHVFVAEPREGILAEMKHRAPDLVAVGTHAPTGIARIVHGSVADYVIHAAEGVDVLVVPPAK